MLTYLITQCGGDVARPVELTRDELVILLTAAKHGMQFFSDMGDTAAVVEKFDKLLS